MPDTPEREALATPDQIEDPRDAAERIVRDPSKKDSPEWLAAMQLLADEGKSEAGRAPFEDLEKEMQSLKGMSEI